MSCDVDFEYTGSFRLTKNEIDEILNNTQNGSTAKEAVEDWICGLDDFDYYIVQEYLKDRIIEYIKQIVKDD